MGVFLNKHAVKIMEFNAVLELVAAEAVSETAKNQILNASPFSKREDILNALAMTREADLLYNKYQINPIVPFKSVSDILVKSQRGAMLNCSELLTVAKLLKSAAYAKRTLLSSPDDVVLLKEMFSEIDICAEMEKEISFAIVGENEVSDNASSKLKEIRYKILNCNLKLKEKLAAYTRSNEYSKYLQDNIVTVREGRYVLPVKAECKGSIKGLVHDVSASGSTVFLEPIAVIELNNELKTATIEEALEIERILMHLTGLVEQRCLVLNLMEKLCTMTDVVFSKMHFSVKNNGVLPEINQERKINLKKARHPLILKEKVVPVDIVAGENYRVLIITGPNTGGKTISLKICGLFCLMAYYGLYLPCEHASIYVYDNIFCDIGDEQSIENELSTFSSHILNIKNITDNVTKNSLVLFDELGGGTDPEEGAALARSIIKYILDVGCTAVVTTHYGELKEFALVDSAIENACMQFNEDNFLPTYKLIIGMPGMSNALKTASRLGLNPKIIDEAYSNLSVEKIKFDNLLKNAEQLKNRSLKELEVVERTKADLERYSLELEKERKKLDALNEKIKDNARAETKRLVSGMTERAQEILEEIKTKIAEADEAALLEAKKLSKKLENISDDLNFDGESFTYRDLNSDEIRVGTVVVIPRLNSTAVIKELKNDKSEVVVSIGQIRTNVKISELKAPLYAKEEDLKKQKQNNSYKKSNKSDIAPVTFLTELKVLGLTVAEAVEVIEPYLLSMANADDGKMIKVIHGKGTGALGKGIHNYLKTSPLVSEYRYGKYGEGDNGVTFITVK